MAATQEASSSPAPSAQVVGNAFVGQYYHILHHSPQLVHRFYQDSSLLSRPDVNGVMTTVTSMQVNFYDAYVHDIAAHYMAGNPTFFLLFFEVRDMYEVGTNPAVLHFSFYDYAFGIFGS